MTIASHLKILEGTNGKSVSRFFRAFMSLSSKESFLFLVRHGFKTEFMGFIRALKTKT
jgi:hypothetical protein